MVAGHAQGNPAFHHIHRQPQAFVTGRSAIDQIANKQRLASHRRHNGITEITVAFAVFFLKPVTEPFQQLPKLVETAVYIADEIERAVFVALIGTHDG